MLSLGPKKSLLSLGLKLTDVQSWVWHQSAIQALQSILTYFARRSINVPLTTWFTDLDWTEKVDLF